MTIRSRRHPPNPDTAPDPELAWEYAAQNPDWRARIHPSGEQGTEAYEASGLSMFEQVRTLIGPDRTQAVWDVGCGDGRVTVPLACWYADVCGIDTSPTMLDRLEARAPIAGYISIGDALALRGRPDACVCIAVLIHLRHIDAAALIGEMAGALRPGGVIVQWLPLYAEGREPASWIDLSTWTLAELEAVADAAGLDVEQADESPGAFRWGDGENRYGHRGPHHESLTVLRKR